MADIQSDSADRAQATPPEPGAPPQDRSDAAGRATWSERMLPWMIGMVVGLTVFFFIASAVQLYFLHYQIANAPQPSLDRPIELLTKAAQGGEQSTALGTTTSSDRLPAATIATLTMLESSAMQFRYHQANVSLLARIWTSYLGFVTGMVLAMVGAVFILGRLEIHASEASIKTAAAEASFKSDSPGLIMAGLGVALMVTTIVTHHEIAVEDRPLYAQGWSIGTPGQTVARPPLLGTKEPTDTSPGAQGVESNPALDKIGNGLGAAGAAGGTQ